MFYIRETARAAHGDDGACGEGLPCATAERRFNHVAVLVALLVFISIPANAVAALDVDEAVRLALLNDPGVNSARAHARALGEEAIADGQLPDPRLKTALINLPVDNFDIDREPMTQLVIGVEQSFPKGNTLRYKRQQGEWLAQAEQARSKAVALSLVRDVRSHFLELYYQVRAEQVVREARGLFKQLVDITQAHYAAGRVSQQDVLSAELELSRLDDRATRILNEADKGRAALKKWIGDAAQLPLDGQFPGLPALPQKAEIASALMEHPLIRSETAKLEASKCSIRIAEEQYKPGWKAGLDYGKRFGDDPDGDSRSDMMSAILSVDLPLFPKNRQDRALAASIQQTETVKMNRDDKLRDLQQMLDTDYAAWQRLGERAALYDDELLRNASANARASLMAYQSGVTEFTTLMRARITDLDVRLEALRVRVDRARTRASLLYLAGENR